MWTAPFFALMSLLGGSGQDVPGDWTLVERPDEQVTAAALRFDGSLTLMVRCQGSELEAVIAGLPAADTRYSLRDLSYGFRDNPLSQRSWWTGGHPSTVFSDVPARTARQWRQGGQVQVRAQPVGGGPATRYVLTIPPSTASVERVLTACGRPLTDPRDATTPDNAPSVPSGFTWQQAPEPRYPARALQRRIHGMATLSCAVSEDGRIDQCQIESERPGQQGFGEEALRAARGARLTKLGDPAATLDVVVFSMRFMVN